MAMVDDAQTPSGERDKWENQRWNENRSLTSMPYEQ